MIARLPRKAKKRLKKYHTYQLWCFIERLKERATMNTIKRVLKELDDRKNKKHETN